MDFTKVKTNLEKKGFKVSVFDTKEKAAEYLCEECKDTSIGIGRFNDNQRNGTFTKSFQRITKFTGHWGK